MSDLLRFVPFTEDLLDRVHGFDLGDVDFQKELGDWLRSDAVAAMQRGTKVWLYVNQAGEIVGYGSLGVTRWKYPDGTARKTDVLIVPAVALRDTSKDLVQPSISHITSSLRLTVGAAPALTATRPGLGLHVRWESNSVAIEALEHR